MQFLIETSAVFKDLPICQTFFHYLNISFMVYVQNNVKINCQGKYGWNGWRIYDG